MNPLFQAGVEIQRFFEEKKWLYCFIGGLAVIRWGEIRMTQDIDLSLFVGFGDEETYAKKLLDSFEPRIPNAVDFALENRVLLISASNKVAVDISFAGLPFEQQMIEHATRFEYSPDCFLLTCSAEDLVVLKAFADRPIDWMDIEGIAVRQGKQLDRDYILNQLKEQSYMKGISARIPSSRKLNNPSEYSQIPLIFLLETQNIHI
jgi:hypothetical protein